MLFWRPLFRFGAGGTINIEGGGLRPSRAAYGFTFVSGFQAHVLAHAEAARSRFVVQGTARVDAMAS